jgi:hypothetical protein
MSNPDDNQHYRLRLRAEAARAAADVSTDPAAHRYALAMEGVIGGEQYDVARRAHNLVHGEPDTSDLPSWSSISVEGQSEEPLQWVGPIDTSALTPDNP